jgi:riboflavin synthase
MFTGIVEEVGTMQRIEKSLRSSIFHIKGKVVFDNLHLGDSICVNGVCLTVTTFSKDIFTADAVHETLERSNLGNLKTGSSVNLERAMPAYGRFGGHIVSGHIDGVGTILKIEKDSNAILYTIKTTKKITNYIIEKGSITIDGISLTVTHVGIDTFGVSVIPHTLKVTILTKKSVGDTVNLENDIVGKYIGKFLGLEQPKINETSITKELLNQLGY